MNITNRDRTRYIKPDTQVKQHTPPSKPTNTTTLQKTPTQTIKPKPTTHPHTKTKQNPKHCKCQKTIKYSQKKSTKKQGRTTVLDNVAQLISIYRILVNHRVIQGRIERHIPNGVLQAFTGKLRSSRGRARNETVRELVSGGPNWSAVRW